MTFDEFEVVCLDVFTEWLPKGVDKASKKRVIAELAHELAELKVLDLEEEFEEEVDSDDEDKPEDLVSLFGD